MKKVLLTVSLAMMICLAFYSSGKAADWVLYGEDATGAKLFYDKASLSRAGNIVTVWTKDQDSNSAGYTRSQWEINCAVSRSKLNAFSTHAPDGAVVESTTMNYPKWRDIAPGSSGEMLRKDVCREEGGS